MFDFSFSELALVVVVALLVVDPKDIPGMLRTCIKWFREVRGITDEVRSSVKNLMDESGVTELRDEMESDLREVAEAPRYIEDQDGKLQRVYDISDFVATTKKDPNP
jgi:sec-independent protein translocase protein TatB